MASITTQSSLVIVAASNSKNRFISHNIITETSPLIFPQHISTNKQSVLGLGQLKKSQQLHHHITRTRTRASASESTTMTEKAGIKIINNPPESKLTELGVRSWPKWGCPPSKFPWTYSAKETCYLLKGKVKVTPDGTSEAVEIGAGDLVVFPKGMSCTWDVSEEVDKHYNFE